MATRETSLYLTTHVLRRQPELLMRSRLLLEVVIVINRSFFFLCLVLFLAGCSNDLSGKQYRNYRRVAGFLNDYYTEKGRYPSSLVQLERHIITKQSQRDGHIDYNPQNILGIINPYNHRAGYGQAYSDAWHFKIVFEQGRPYILNCENREILYHPANHFQGFVLFDCFEQETGNKKSFDYANVFCYQRKCTYGVYFEYNAKTKDIHVDHRSLSFNAF